MLGRPSSGNGSSAARPSSSRSSSMMPVRNGPASAIPSTPVLRLSAGRLDALGDDLVPHEPAVGEDHLEVALLRQHRPVGAVALDQGLGAEAGPLLVDHARHQHVAGRPRARGEPLDRHHRGGDAAPSCRWCRDRACGRRGCSGRKAQGSAPTTSVWPQNISVRPPPVPRRRPTTFGRPGAASHTSTSSPARSMPLGQYARRPRPRPRPPGTSVGLVESAAHQLGQQLGRRRSRVRSAGAAHDQPGRQPHLLRRRVVAADARQQPLGRPPGRARRPAGRRRSAAASPASSSRGRRSRPARARAGSQSPQLGRGLEHAVGHEVVGGEDRGRPVGAIEQAAVPPPGASAWVEPPIATRSSEPRSPLRRSARR